MITPLMFPIWKQRDPRWSNQRLGTVNGTTIGGFGCLITTIAMANTAFGGSGTPADIDNLFTQNGGYANGNLVVWTAIQRLLPHVAHLGMDSCVYSPAPIGKLKQHLDNGGLAALQVGFGGDINQMHWVLADGYNGDNIIKCDPWYGDETDFTSRDSHGRPRYGSGDAAKDIFSIHYFAQGINPPAPVADPPARPVAKLPTENPIPIEQTVPNPRVDPQPDPVPEAPSDMTPAAGDGVVPVPVTVIPEYEATYTPVSEDRTILREHAFALDVVSGEYVAIDIPLGTTVKVAGYFRYNNVNYARSEFAVKSGRYNGVDVSFFEEPNGQPSGVVPVTTPEVSTPTNNPTILTPEVATKVTVVQKIVEILASIVARIIKKRNA